MPPDSTTDRSGADATNRRRWPIRRVLRWLAGTIGAGVVGLGAFAGWSYATADVSTVGRLEFANPLAIPPLLAPEVDPGGRKVFTLDLQEGATDLLPGRETPTWGANGSYLGPTLRARRGDVVVVNVRNRLPEPTTIHWHGMHLPAAADGGPRQLIEPGTSWSPEWTVDQPAATLWYHPHPHGATADHVYRGIAGLFLLDDPSSDDLGLPSDYGVDDIPVIVQDKRFNTDGTLDFGARSFSPVGVLGSDLVVNGTHDPHVDITTTRVRLRLLNASNARVYDFGFDDDREFALIATDGGFLAAPHRTNRVQLSPGERAEVIVDVDAGESVVLRSYPPDLGAGRWQDRFAGGHDRFDVLELRAAADLSPAPATPDRLASFDDVEPASAQTTRRFELGGSSRINGRRMDHTRIDATVTVDTTEIWEVDNTSGTPHSFHVHDIQFRILDLGGAPPPPELSGWKDTVYIPPGQAVRLIAEFTDYADPSVPYMFHCHILRHEDRGMMGQFLVVDEVA